MKALLNNERVPVTFGGGFIAISFSDYCNAFISWWNRLEIDFETLSFEAGNLGIGSGIALFSCGLTVDDHWRASYRRSTGVAHAASDRTGVGRLAIHRESANAQMTTKLHLAGAEILASSYVCAATVAGKVN